MGHAAQKVARVANFVRTRSGWPHVKGALKPARVEGMPGMDILVIGAHRLERHVAAARAMHDSPKIGVVVRPYGPDITEWVVVMPLKSFGRLAEAYVNAEVMPRHSEQE